MDRTQAIELIQTGIDLLGGEAVLKASYSHSPARTILSHLFEIRFQLERGAAASWPMIHVSWMVVLKYKLETPLEPWLRKHGRELVEFFISEQRATPGAQ